MILRQGSKTPLELTQPRKNLDKEHGIFPGLVKTHSLARVEMGFGF
jgi:hypothetical protein